MVIRNRDIDLSACDITITVEGVLRFRTNNGSPATLTLSANSTINLGSGGEIRVSIGGTSSGTEANINIGGNETWDGTDGNLTGPGVMDDTSVDGSLPIVLGYFTAKSEEDAVRIDWTTLSELNNDYFSIERSTNGIDFEEVHRIAGSGTTIQEMNYAWTDNDPLAGTTYYRLKQTDYDGQYEIFHTVMVRRQRSNAQLKAYPNPTSSKITLTQVDTEHVRIFNLSGQEVTDQVAMNHLDDSSLQLNLEHLNPGPFIVRSGQSIIRIYKK